MSNSCDHGGLLTEKFDGGRRAVLCDKCRTILGYRYPQAGDSSREPEPPVTYAAGYLRAGAFVRLVHARTPLSTGRHGYTHRTAAKAVELAEQLAEELTDLDVWVFEVRPVRRVAAHPSDRLDTPTSGV